MISAYGVATISRVLKTIGLFCKRALQKRLYSAKEAFDVKEPTNRSHPICLSTYINVLFICIRFHTKKMHDVTPLCCAVVISTPPANLTISSGLTTLFTVTKYSCDWYWRFFGNKDICVYINICVYVYTYTNTHIHIHIYLYIHIYIYRYVYMKTYAHIYMYIYMYVYTQIHVCAYTYIYVYIHIYLYNICTCTYLSVYT